MNEEKLCFETYFVNNNRYRWNACMAHTNNLKNNKQKLWTYTANHLSSFSLKAALLMISLHTFGIKVAHENVGQQA